MTDAIGQLFQPLLDVLDSPVAQFILQLAFFYLLLLWVASAWWVFRDASARLRNPTAPYFVSAGVILATPLLFVFAIFIWRIVRPKETLAELEAEGLAEELLRAELDRVLYCASCGRRVREDWLRCPTCRGRLARVCPDCKRLVGLDWAACAWCGRDLAAPAAQTKSATG